MLISIVNLVINRCKFLSTHIKFLSFINRYQALCIKIPTWVQITNKIVNYEYEGGNRENLLITHYT